MKIKASFSPKYHSLHLGHILILDNLKYKREQGHYVNIVLNDFVFHLHKKSYHLTDQQVEQNLQIYEKQIKNILPQCDILFQSTWLKILSGEEIMGFLSYITLQDYCEMIGYNKTDHIGVNLSELFYYAFLVYDSIFINAHIEIYANHHERLVNLIRKIRSQKFQFPKFELIHSLVGYRGTERMGINVHNAIFISDEPKIMFDKFLSIPDEHINDYYCAFKLMRMEMNAKKAKIQLALGFITRFHSSEAAKQVLAEFDALSENRIPDQLPTIEITLPGIQLIELIVQVGLVQNRSQAFKLIKQDAVKLNGFKLTYEERAKIFLPGDQGILQIGKRFKQFKII
jgi:tyrosyl-tRNA synthetase